MRPATPRGFTLVELLVVISIMGLLAAITLPNLGKFKPSVMAAATQQLLTDVARARQLAITHHTTVYMVFVPMFTTNTAFQSLAPAEKPKTLQVLDRQLTGYAFVSLRSIGDQPGRPTARYLSSWKTLPEGTMIPAWKFFVPLMALYTNDASGASWAASWVYGFDTTTRIPFPSLENPVQPNLPLPYIAFDHLGRVVDDNGVIIQRPELFGQPAARVPLAKGNVSVQRDASKVPILGSTPTVTESPAGNSTNSFSLVSADALTGRVRAEREEAQ